MLDILVDTICIAGALFGCAALIHSAREIKSATGMLDRAIALNTETIAMRAAIIEEREATRVNPTLTPPI